MVTGGPPSGSMFVALTERGYKLGYRSGYKALSWVISGAIRGLSRHKFGREASQQIPHEATCKPTYNLT